MRRILAVLLLFAFPAQADPLASPLFAEIRAQVLGDGPIVFDPRVSVMAPVVAEDSSAVPVAVRVDLPNVRTIVLFADYNPIPKILALYPTRAEPFVATRVKIAMATPLRAAAQTEDGVWHLGGAWIDAAGGGCTAPSFGSASPDWQSRLGEIHARAWPRGQGSSRVRFRLLHPMDTGLAGNIPAYFLERTILSDAKGELVRIETFEPVAENPMLTVEVKARPGKAGFHLQGRDNNGSEFKATIREGKP